jgi:hypothetical protein
MFIPGSHNSGMYTVENDRLYTSQKIAIVPNFLKKGITSLSINQNLNIAEQLSIGIKYFTFKLCKINNEIFVTHTFVGPKFEICIRDICDYISINQGTIYIMLTYITDILDSDIISLLDKYSRVWREHIFFISTEIPYFNTTDINVLNRNVLHSNSSFSYTLTPSITDLIVNMDITSKFVEVSKYINVSNFRYGDIFINFDFVNREVVDAVEELNKRFL